MRVGIVRLINMMQFGLTICSRDSSSKVYIVENVLFDARNISDFSLQWLSDTLLLHSAIVANFAKPYFYIV